MKKTNRSQLKKNASVPCLYRHEANGRYYGVKKHDGKIINKALTSNTGDPITKLQEAKAALADWLASLNQPATLADRFEGGGQFTIGMIKEMLHPQPLEDEAKETVLRTFFGGLTLKDAEKQGVDLGLVEKSPDEIKKEKEAAEKKRTPTLSECFAQFKQFKANNGKATLEKYDYMKRGLELHGDKNILNKPIAEITPEDLAASLNKFPTTKKPQYFNTLSLVLNQVFEMARIKRYIAVNPFTLLPKNIVRRKVAFVRDEVPTIEQCEAIVKSMRGQKASDSREVSANLCQFIHLAALGQAEAGFLTWADIDFEHKVIRAKRIKTGKHFEVPIYPHLEPFLVALAEGNPNRKPKDKLFKIESMQKALYAACERLGLPSYSPRDLRKARIVWLLRKGIPVELIAKWQGHSDNGVLVRRTYANVIDDAAAAFQKEQLKKLK